VRRAFSVEKIICTATATATASTYNNPICEYFEGSFLCVDKNPAKVKGWLGGYISFVAAGFRM